MNQKNSINADSVYKMLSKFIKDKKLAIDIGSRTLKGLELQKEGDILYIQDVFKIDGMEKYFKGKDISNIEGVVDALHRITKMKEMKVKDIDLIYNSSNLQTKITKIPNVDEKEIAEFAEIEFGKNFSNHTPSLHTLDYSNLGSFTQDEKTEIMLLLASLPIEEAQNVIRAFDSKKFTVKTLESTIGALANALKMAKTEEEYKTILHLGNDKSIIVFMKGDVACFHRVFNFGYNHLVREMQQDLKTSLNNIGNIVKTVGLQFDIETKSDIDKNTYMILIQELFNNFINEVFRSISYVKMNLKFEVNEIYLTGGLSQVKGLTKMIDSGLDVKSKLWSFNGSRVEGTKQIINETGIDLGPEFAIALGLAVRGVK